MSSIDLVGIVMRSLRIGACLLTGVALSARTHAACTVLSEVEVGQAGLLLSDLLAPGACPKLANAAAKVRLGAAPLVGSVRVLEGSEVLAQLERIRGTLPATVIEVPKRIRVRRSGRRLSCAEIEANLLPTSGMFGANGIRSAPTTAGNVTQPDIGCGADILNGTPIEISASRWDAGLGSWELRGRCQHREDCVPFLVQVQRQESSAALLSGHALDERNVSLGKAQGPRQKSAEPRPGPAWNHLSSATLIRRGQSASLVWDQQGIRVIVLSVSLDAGNEGDTVRARIARSGRVVRATVTGPGWLRMAS